MSDTAMNSTLPVDGTEQMQQQDMSQPGVGAQLAAHRQVQSWTVEQVASQLNLAPRQIQALEADNYAALPGMASVRGFIRAYAKLLKIDAAPLIVIVGTETAPPNEPMQTRRPLSKPFSDNSSLPSLGRGGPSVKSLASALATILLLAGIFAGYQLGWIPQPESGAARVSTPPDPASVAMQSASVEDVPASSKAEPVEMASDPSSTADTTPVNVSVTLATPPAVAVTPKEDIAKTQVANAPAPSVAKTSVVPGKDTLMLKIMEDSWIEVRRVNGPQANSVVLSHLVTAGSTEAVEVTEPMSLTIGNAAGVDATLRGKPVDVKTAAKSNVARLNLK